MILPLLAWVLRAEFPGACLFAACGVLLISGVVGQHAYGRDSTAGASYGVGAGVAYAGFLFLLRQGGGDLRRTAGGLCVATAVATVTAIAAGLVIGNADLVPSWPGAGWLIVLAITSQVSGWLLIARSLPRAPAALVALLDLPADAARSGSRRSYSASHPASCSGSALRSSLSRFARRRSCAAAPPCPSPAPRASGPQPRRRPSF